MISRALPDWLPTGAERPTHAKIVATLGPATDDPDALERMLEAGVSILRLNFSHGGLEAQGQRLERVRAVTASAGRPIAILGDLQGPKIRVGPVPDADEGGGIVVRTGEEVCFRADCAQAGRVEGRAVFGTGFDRIYHDVEPGQRVLVNDGAVRMLAVDRAEGRWLRCAVTVGGRITSRKGINLPDSDLMVPAITDQDWACAEWAVARGLDYLALSFVRTGAEVMRLKERLTELCPLDHEHADPDAGPGIPVIAKIEKPQALVNLDEILAASDGVMVARGDLGVEMDAAQVPVAQKHIVRRAAAFGKPSIVATQMLESMIESATPTRAEASDVANAIFDGAGAVMLSGETAVGRHPGLVVETMRRVVQVAEARMDQLAAPPVPPEHLDEYPYRSAAMAEGAWHIARRARAKVVIVWSQSGGMARYLSQNDFRVPIVACTSSAVASRRMCLLAGVRPLLCQPPDSGRLSDWTDDMEAYIKAAGLAADGDAALLIAGKPLGSVKSQDLLSILRVGDPDSGFRAK